jgi:tetratricopeptide (TPR) repeat protein
VARAEALRDQGAEPDLETLCAAAPDLLPEVRDRLAKLAAVDALLAPPPRPVPAIHALAARYGYRIVRELGGGNMGLVYEARDPHGRTVALKTLNRADANRLAYLKREFEALADVRHENLVAIYGQVSDGDSWFYVMEHVPGRHFLDHVHRPGALRPALVQLARGIQALHRAHRLHRDIKSSNVLVRADGQVKLLDYGLVAELDDAQAYAQVGLVGTVGYMSPEQCGSRPLTPASDWYSFGALLYEALTGRLPFQGAFLDILARKQSEDPPPPAALTFDVPDDLNALCVELLRIDPAGRPTGAEVLRRLGAESIPQAPSTEDVLVGRERHLAALRGALADVREGGKPVLVEVHGPSGAGKSALARRFLRDAQADGAVVLAGQCYEQSAVPYKALDSLVGALCRYLRKLPREKVDALLPVHLGELARLFPVFGRLEAVAEAAPARADDPHEVRRRAQGALRELLHRMSRLVPVVLFVDDLHWGDAESAALLDAVGNPPDAPPVLFVAGYRRAEGADSPFVRALREMGVRRVDVPVDPLPADEAWALAAALLGDVTGGQADLIARESDGSPLLLHELVRFFRSETAADGLTLDTVLRARAGRLADEPRRLLDVIAVAPGPIDPDTAGRAAELPPERLPGAVDELLVGKFVRALPVADGRRVEVYHDRIREAVAGGLAADERANYHRRLAVAHQVRGDAGPEVLAFHLTRAGEAARAAPVHAAAAEQAVGVLAFDRAADHYRQALAGIAADDPRRREWLVALAQALAGAGRGREAADAFTGAADRSTGTEALFCRQRAAEQLIRCGHYDEGVTALRAVFAAAGIAMPKTPAALARSVLWLRVRSWLRGYRFRERSPEQVSAADRLRIDVFLWAAEVVRMVDHLPGTWLHYRGLRLSLRAGDPYAVAVSLAHETTIGLPFRPPSPAHIERVQARARAVAHRVSDPARRAAALAVIQMHRPIANLLVGDFRRALAEFGPAYEAIDRCATVSAAYQRSVVRVFEALVLLFLGDLPRLRAVFDAEYRGQVERGSLRGAVVLPVVSRAHQLELAADRPAAARGMIREAIDRWGQTEFGLLALYAWWAEMDVLLYEGRAATAWEHCEGAWGRANWQSLLSVAMAALLADWARARAAVARAAELDGDQAAPFRREAKRMARRIERIRGLPIAAPHGWLIRAAVAHQEGRATEAIGYLERAEAAFETAGMALYAAAARRRRGELIDGDPGRDLVTAADAAMGERGVRAPERFVEVHAPGFASHRGLRHLGPPLPPALRGERG